MKYEIKITCDISKNNNDAYIERSVDTMKSNSNKDDNIEITWRRLEDNET
jgi:hypothetical protein